MRELTKQEKRCIIELINDRYACTENTFSDEGLKPEDAITNYKFMLDSEIGTDYIWNDIVREKFIFDNANFGTGVETKHIRYCGKDVVKSYIKSHIEKWFPYSNTSLSETERLELFSKAWMF